MHDLRSKTCCFSGYRIEKMPFSANDTAAADALCATLDRAVERAALQGYTRFLSGMSTGFDLWAAQAVLRARAHFPVELLCAVPFDRQADQYPAIWKRSFNQCLPTGYMPCPGNIIPAATRHATVLWWMPPPS